MLYSQKKCIFAAGWEDMSPAGSFLSSFTMHIRHAFHTLNDVERRLGPRFAGRLRRLLHAYKRYHKSLHISSVMRAVSLALAFATLAEEGDMARAGQFDAMLHGHGCETIELEGETLLFSEEGSTEETLFWDTVCLLLDEHEPDTDMPQAAYDLVDGHEWLAYRLGDENNEPSEPSPAPSAHPLALPNSGGGIHQGRGEVSEGPEEASLLHLLTHLASDNARLTAEVERLRSVVALQQQTINQLIQPLPQPMKEGMTINYNAPIINNGTMNGDINHPTYYIGSMTGEDKRKLAIECMEAHIREKVAQGAPNRQVLAPYVAAVRVALVPSDMNHEAFNQKYGCMVPQSTFSEFVPKKIEKSAITDDETEAYEKEYSQLMKM